MENKVGLAIDGRLHTQEVTGSSPVAPTNPTKKTLDLGLCDGHVIASNEALTSCVASQNDEVLPAVCQQVTILQCRNCGATSRESPSTVCRGHRHGLKCEFVDTGQVFLPERRGFWRTLFDWWRYNWRYSSLTLAADELEYGPEQCILSKDQNDERLRFLFPLQWEELETLRAGRLW